jgi:asparagine N-glycosylation enzyme membrane subunit Stt3
MNVKRCFIALTKKSEHLNPAKNNYSISTEYLMSEKNGTNNQYLQLSGSSKNVVQKQKTKNKTKIN